GETGVVASERYQAALTAKGLYAMRNAEAVAGFQWALQADWGRIACGSVKFSAVDEADKDYALPATILSTDRALALVSPSLDGAGNLLRHAAIEAKPVANLRTGGQDLDRQLNELSIAYIVEALRQLGFKPRSDQKVSTDTLMEQLRILPLHRRLVERMLAMLEEDALLEARADGGWVIKRWPVSIDTDTDARRLFSQYEAYRADLSLFTRCGTQLASCLRGECQPLQLLFPEGSLDNCSDIYKESPFFLYFNRKAQEVVRTRAAIANTERPLRLLEIGAGTGGTTHHLLSVLPAERSQYRFTDLSPLFLHKAAEKFAAFPFVDYELLDIERDPETQGYTAHSYDIVIAANVLHATRDLRTTVRHVARLLAPGGTLVLLESLRPQRWMDLVFGLTDGWWRFTDTDLRARHPLLSGKGWQRVLNEAGFAEVEVMGEPDSAGDPRQALITAKTCRVDNPAYVRSASADVATRLTSIHVPAPILAPLSGAPSTRMSVRDVLTQQIARSLRVPIERIAADKNFTELGVDSLIGVEIMGAVKKALSLPLSPTLLFEYPTINDLSCFLEQQYAAELAGQEQMLRVPTTVDRVVISNLDGMADLDVKYESAEELLRLYEALPGNLQYMVDNASTPDDANELILRLSRGGRE
ncbi:MAG: methyltransferase, partial [Gammaproteobacteria bacterium]